MAVDKKIEKWEVDRYWEIFNSLLPPGASHLDGSQAATVLKNSRLRDDQLERVWDLADVDKDGSLDFEEFCIAMRVVFDLVNGEYADVPKTLPAWLVPESKAHLVQASRAISTGHLRAAEMDEDEDEGPGGLKDGFDWYIAPGQRAQYEDIYNSSRDGHGYVSFEALLDLYSSLDVPDTDIRSAWNLVNPAVDEVIGKDACLAFLHVLRARHDGFRMPRTVPPSLRASFEKKDVDYNIDRVRLQAGRQMGDESTFTGRKAKFGDTYLSRLGSGAGADKYTKGTDFSNTKTTEDWEEVRLKKQLRELEAKIEKIDMASKKREERGGRRDDSRPALVKRELEQLLDYKRRELRELESGDGGPKPGQDLREIDDEIKTIKEQVDALQAHLQKREQTLEDLKNQVRVEKGR